MDKIKDNKLYSLHDISVISGVREVTLRERLSKDKPEIILKNGVFMVKGKDAKKLIPFRKRGRKPLYIN